ncbi:MAG: hypothetical protein Q8L24_00590 [bacterium]|nr:hypothetical protein [bacterium]
MAGYIHIKEAEQTIRHTEGKSIAVVSTEEMVAAMLKNFLDGNSDGSVRLISRNHRLPNLDGTKQDVVWIQRHNGKIHIMLRHV